MNIIIFVVLYIAAYFSILLYKKSNKSLNITHWAIITFILLSCFDAFFVATTSLIVHFQWLQINISHLIIIVSILTVSFINNKTINKSTLQIYYFDKTDLYIFVILLVLSFAVAFRRFGFDFSKFHYYISDSHIHYNNAIGIFKSNSIYPLFFAHLCDAELLYVANAFMPEYMLYRIFSICQTFILFGSGAMFWIAIRENLVSKKKIIGGLLFTLLYIMGYPLYALLTGYEYWSVAVILICLILHFIKLYTDNALRKSFIVVMIMLLNSAIVVCYNLFVPALFIGEFVCLALYLYNKKQLFTYKTILSGIIGFGVPSFLFLYRTFHSMLNSSMQTVTESFKIPGPIHRNLFSDFIPIGFFVMLFFIKEHNKKHKPVVYWPIIIWLVYMFYMLMQIKLGIIKTYYYFKLYNVLWLFFFMAAAKAIFESSLTIHVKAYIGFMLILGIIAYSDIEYESHYWCDDELSNDKKVQDLFSLYSENNLLLKGTTSSFITDDAQELYLETAKLVATEQTEIRIITDSDEHHLQAFYALSRQTYPLDAEDYSFLTDTFTKHKYVAVSTDSTAYASKKDILNNYPVVYENNFGKIYIIQAIN